MLFKKKSEYCTEIFKINYIFSPKYKVSHDSICSGDCLPMFSITKAYVLFVKRVKGGVFSLLWTSSALAWPNHLVHL